MTLSTPFCVFHGLVRCITRVALLARTSRSTDTTGRTGLTAAMTICRLSLPRKNADGCIRRPTGANAFPQRDAGLPDTTTPFRGSETRRCSRFGRVPPYRGRATENGRSTLNSSFPSLSSVQRSCPPNCARLFLGLSPGGPVRENGGSITIFDWAAVYVLRLRLIGVVGPSEALVKSRRSARIRRKFTRNHRFYNSDTYFEIGSARPIFADFAAPA